MSTNIPTACIQIGLFVLLDFTSSIFVICLTLDCFQLANIVWGEADGSDDHIVPYPEASEDLHKKKDRNQEASVIKLIEQKITEANTEFHGRKLGSSSKLDSSAGLSALGYGTNSWPDLSLSSSAQTDQGSQGTEVSKSLGEISKFSSIRGGKLLIAWHYE